MRYSTDTIYDERFNSIIDNEKYIFKATLFNPDGDILTLTKGSILGLELIDNIFEPWLKGTIVLDNEDDALERFVTSPTAEEFQDDVKSEKGYTVRGDGRDLLELTIIPLQAMKEDYGAQDDDFNKAFSLKYTFTLDDEETISNNGKSAKRFSIIDYDLQILKESKAFFSSVDLIEKNTGFDTQLSNKDREVATGKCIKSILSKTLNDKQVVEFEDVEQTITPFFEDGISKIFYSSPSESSAYDDINYILDRHVSSNTKNDFSVLKKANFTGQYTLQSVASIFEKGYNPSTQKTGSSYIENLTITGGGNDSGSVVQREAKKPIDAIEFGEKGDVLDFKFFNTASKIRREKIKSYIVHSYDYNKKEFNIDTTDSNIENIRETFTQNYVSTLKGKDNKPHPNLIINGIQKNNTAFKNVYSEYGESPNIRKSYGVNKLLKNSLVTNMGIEIVVKGQLFRKSGKFFSLDREGDYIDNVYDNKLLGMYFILDVQHIFDNNQYLNKIIATKTYHFENPKINEERL